MTRRMSPVANVPHKLAIRMERVIGVLSRHGAHPAGHAGALAALCTAQWDTNGLMVRKEARDAVAASEAAYPFFIDSASAAAISSAKWGER
ncbi:jg4184 [Pararge aegeria aegeria]|uniref:Jg4184 protein n=1 Tax=Pararge aegeria aegeria TaxID=348720 RepID=A0A8S4S9T0_9NEOP|nr:jg4184 [Pararge aegeria aegeria]